MEKRYYIAYGSNLNVRQMKMRCPTATVCGTSKLDGWTLLFKGSKTGFYLTIEKEQDSTLPVVIWEVTEADEKALDRYEGYPDFYYKKELKVRYKGIRTGRYKTVTAFVYIMHENRPIGVPTDMYLLTCMEGYDTFYFDPAPLLTAYVKATEVCQNERE